MGWLLARWGMWRLAFGVGEGAYPSRGRGVGELLWRRPWGGFLSLLSAPVAAAPSVGRQGSARNCCPERASLVGGAMLQ